LRDRIGKESGGMSEPVSVTLKVNGKALTAAAATADTLLTVLRDKFLLTGAKRGCNQGVCGACTVLADGRPVRSCLSLAFDCDDRRIDTIEGLANQPIMQALQRAFIAGGAFQCGFCTPAMLVASFALLQSNPRPSEGEIRGALSGNYCRCTGYKKIVEAVLVAAGRLPAEASA
jgi:aerobic-type carbon monoxide dehydrogenase small subunit (CoxS/CutS family)